MPSLMRTWHVSYDCTPRGSSDRKNEVVETTASQLSREETVRLRNRDWWDELIDHTLINMGLNPQAYADADEGVAPPSQAAIAKAVKFALSVRERMLVPAGQILADGNGGLMIQHALPDGATESFEADAAGNCSIWFYPRAPQKPTQTPIEFTDDNPD